MYRYIISISIAAFLLIGFASCNRQQRDAVSLKVMSDEKAIRELTEAAETVNKACPIHTDNKTTLLAVSFREHKWTYYYEVAEDSVVRFDNAVFNENIKAGLKASTRENLLASHDMLTMLRALIKVNADLVYSYKGKESGHSINVMFTYPELRVMVDVMSAEH